MTGRLTRKVLVKKGRGAAQEHAVAVGALRRDEMKLCDRELFTAGFSERNGSTAIEVNTNKDEKEGSNTADQWL